MMSVEESLPEHVLVVGVIRNGEKTIRRAIKSLSESIPTKDKISFLIVESDSQDQTVRVLEELKKTYDCFDYITLGQLSNKYPLRTERIAFCRNQYLDAIKNDYKYRNVSYVVVADLDGINSDLTKSSYRSCWRRDDWDVCTANQDGAYYDIWALRHKLWNPCDCWEQYEFLRMHNVGKSKALWAAVYSKMFTINKDEDWIEVDSAFGGIAIYKKHAICEGRYIGLTDAGNEICEHVPLNLSLRESGYKIFINPTFINAKATEHASRRFLYIRIIHKAKSVFLETLKLFHH